MVERREPRSPEVRLTNAREGGYRERGLRAPFGSKELKFPKRTSADVACCLASTKIEEQANRAVAEPFCGKATGREQSQRDDKTELSARDGAA